MAALEKMGKCPFLLQGVLYRTWICAGAPPPQLDRGAVHVYEYTLVYTVESGYQVHAPIGITVKMYALDSEGCQIARVKA